MLSFIVTLNKHNWLNLIEMNSEVSYFLELNEENNDKDNGTNNTEPQPNEINTNQVKTYVL